MTPAELIVEHCLATSADLPVERRVILLRALAVEIGDRDLASKCRALARQLEEAQLRQSQLLLDLRARAA